MSTRPPLKPGEFRATCNLTRPHPISELPEYLRREYAANGWKQGYREVRIRRALLTVECFLEPLCEGLDTTDRAVFEDHMTRVHGKRFSNGENAGLVRAAKGTWRTPAAKPFTPDNLTVFACPSCGLVAEVDNRAANALWWDEHLRGCALAVSA